MPAANVNLTIEQGSDFSFIVQYNDNNNNGVDLSNKCILFRFLDDNNIYRVFSNQSNSSLDLANGGYVLSGDSEGTINLTIGSEVTKNYDFTTANYDLDILETINGVPRNTRILTGQISLILRNFPVISDCTTITSDSSAEILDITTTPEEGVTPTPTPTESQISEILDLCIPEDCLEIDTYAIVYTGSGLSIYDNSTSSGTLTLSDTRNITNVELAINNLKHEYPQDLAFILAPPSGDKILLSAHDKIVNYNSNFSYMFSNKAIANSFLNNVEHGGVCNIRNKTDIYNYNDENLNSGFDHLFGNSITGDWSLYIRDDDIGASGTIGSWKLIITYEP